MKFNPFVSLLFCSLALAGCDPEAAEDVELLVEDTFDPVDPDLDDFAAAETVQDLRRQARSFEVPPAVEVDTDNGGYVSFFVEDDGGVAIFEWTPDRAVPAAGSVTAETAAELYLAIAPEGSEVPEVLLDTLPLAGVASDPAELEPPFDPGTIQQDPPEPLAATSCTRSQANYFYDYYRPGARGSEYSTQYSYLSYTGREARRRKWVTNFDQVNSTRWTPESTWGGSSDYLRTSGYACGSNIRVTAWKCRQSQPTKDNGCGESGSSILTTYGPYSFSSGGGTYSLAQSGNYIFRGRVDWVGSSETAGFTYFNGPYSTGEINNCFY